MEDDPGVACEPMLEPAGALDGSAVEASTRLLSWMTTSFAAIRRMRLKKLEFLNFSDSSEATESTSCWATRASSVSLWGV